MAQAEFPHSATQDAPVKDAPSALPGWTLGVSAANAPTRAGAVGRETSFRPVFAGQLGRWMVSTSSALSLNPDGVAGGVSTKLSESGKWSTGLGVRLTQGRSADGDPLLEGMPRIRASAAARVSARYAITPVWSGMAQWQQDLLHAQGGRANVGLTARWPLGNGWMLNTGAGVSWLNRQAMQTFYGVPEEAAQTGRAAYGATAGLEQWSASVGAMWAVDRHWRVSSSWSTSRLVGAAAASPLTVRRGGNSLQLTVAYVGW